MSKEECNKLRKEDIMEVTRDFDLRHWLDYVAGTNEIKYLNGTDWNEEIGTISELNQRTGRYCLLFDEIKGYPKGYRIITGSISSLRRISYTLNVQEETNWLGIVNGIRKRLNKFEPLPPKEVTGGPVLENVQTGDKIDLFQFPTPKWHKFDGARYIGTATQVIMKDPDDGWVNVGTYRTSIIDKNHLTTFIVRGKDDDIIREKYFAKGKPCPAAIVFGADPLLFVLSATPTTPFGTSEYDVAGYFLGRPLEVIRGEVTGLPLPATAEIVVEGEYSPTEKVVEGPFGEWTGYYYGHSHAPEPLFTVKSLMFRNEPIILGAPPCGPYSDAEPYTSAFMAAGIWQELENAGIPGVVGVFRPRSGCNWTFTVVAIKQMYPGHSKAAATIAGMCKSGSYACKYIIVVDDDIDPSDLEQVMWAVCIRSRPGNIDIIRNCFTSSCDFTGYGGQPPERLNLYTDRCIIDACVPWAIRSSVSSTTFAKPEDMRKVKDKWGPLLT